MRTLLHHPTASRADDRYERLQRPCPTCGQLGVRIVYGHPSGTLVTAARRGKLIVGGCIHRAATHRCPNGHEWATSTAA